MMQLCSAIAAIGQLTATVGHSWVDVVLSGPYANDGDAITVTTVPEPGSAALTVLVLPALAAVRLRPLPALLAVRFPQRPLLKASTPKSGIGSPD
jgi:hypothetical protein